MNVAEQVLDWLFTEQLRCGEHFSYPLPTGFTWWADEFAQTAEFLGEQTGPGGETGYLLCVRTEVLRELDLTEEALAQINALPMRCASLAGPVYDAPARRLDLWSQVRVTEENNGWLRYLLAAAAVTQIAEARLLAPGLAEATAALAATSAHPQSGPRNTPHQMSFAAGTFADSGEDPCAWPESEFREAISHEAVRRCLDRSGVPSATLTERGITVEFPFGDSTSCCRLVGDQPHPLYGNGLLVVQRFPVTAASEPEGVKLALSLNAADLTREPTGYGLGSYVYSDDAVHFTGFLPNALHKPGLLPNLVLSCSARAGGMAGRFVEGRWDGERYSLDPAILARREQRLQAMAPPPQGPMGGCPMARARAEGR